MNEVIDIHLRKGKGNPTPLFPGIHPAAGTRLPAASDSATANINPILGLLGFGKVECMVLSKISFL